MKKLSKEKRMHLILVGLVTLGVMAGLWFGIISAQTDKLKEIDRRSQNVQADIEKMQKVITASAQVNEELKDATAHIGKVESTMASGDLFSWINSTLKQFNVPSYKVDMPQFSTPTVGEVRLLPAFPYNQASVTVSGSAYYFDFGKFVADLENRYPNFRVQNLTLEPGIGANPEEHERLFFRMEIVTLVKPNAT